MLSLDRWIYYWIFHPNMSSSWSREKIWESSLRELRTWWPRDSDSDLGQSAFDWFFCDKKNNKNLQDTERFYKLYSITARVFISCTATPPAQRLALWAPQIIQMIIKETIDLAYLFLTLKKMKEIKDLSDERIIELPSKPCRGKECWQMVSLHQTKKSSRKSENHHNLLHIQNCQNCIFQSKRVSKVPQQFTRVRVGRWGLRDGWRQGGSHHYPRRDELVLLFWCHVLLFWCTKLQSWTNWILKQDVNSCNAWCVRCPWRLLTHPKLRNPALLDQLGLMERSNAGVL